MKSNTIKDLLSKAKSTAIDASQKMNNAIKSINIEEITSNLNVYERYFSDKELLDKIKKFGKTIGATVLYPVLLLFNLLKSGEIDLAQKAAIIGTLGYFILPADLIPDMIAGIGYTDDAMTLTAAIAKFGSCISEQIQQESKRILHTYIGDFDERSLDTITDILHTGNNLIKK